MQPSITKKPSAELKIQIIKKKDTKTDRFTKIQVRVIFRIVNLTFLSPYLWADWGRGLEVCSRRIAPDDLITKSCYFQLQQLLYNFSHSSYPMLLATSINKLKIAVNSLKFGIACIISVYLFIICWKTYWMASTIISQKHRYWQSQPFFAFCVHTLWNLKYRIFCLLCDI